MEMRVKIVNHRETMKEKVAARERRIQILRDIEKTGIDEIQKTYQELGAKKAVHKAAAIEAVVVKAPTHRQGPKRLSGMGTIQTGG